MTLAADLRAGRGELLSARGSVVTPELVERLHNLPAGRVAEPIVIAAGDAGAG